MGQLVALDVKTFREGECSPLGAWICGDCYRTLRVDFLSSQKLLAAILLRKVSILQELAANILTLPVRRGEDGWDDPQRFCKHNSG